MNKKNMRDFIRMLEQYKISQDKNNLHKLFAYILIYFEYECKYMVVLVWEKPIRENHQLTMILKVGIISTILQKYVETCKNH